MDNLQRLALFAMDQPQWSADPHVIGVGQTIAVGIGWIGAMILTRRLLAPNRHPLVGSRVTP
jgi:hypothetical protein